MLALRDAAAAVGGWRLSEVTVVVTLEPGPMCGCTGGGPGARLVYGASDPGPAPAGNRCTTCAGIRGRAACFWKWPLTLR